MSLLAVYWFSMCLTVLFVVVCLFVCLGMKFERTEWKPNHRVWFHSIENSSSWLIYLCVEISLGVILWQPIWLSFLSLLFARFPNINFWNVMWDVISFKWIQKLCCKYEDPLDDVYLATIESITYVIFSLLYRSSTYLHHIWFAYLFVDDSHKTAK